MNDIAISALQQIAGLAAEWDANKLGGVDLQRLRWRRCGQIAANALSEIASQPSPAVQGQMFPQGDDLPLFTAPADVDQDEWITRLAQNIHDSQPALFWPMPERDQVADIYYWLLDHDGALDTSAAGILALADQYAAQIDR